MENLTFDELNAIDCSAHTSEKGGFTYLAWTFAHQMLAERDPDYTYRAHDFPVDSEGVIQYPYLITPAGCFVRVTVSFQGKEWTETLPVLDFRNKTIPAESISAMDVNSAIKRCFVKAAAHFGIGLYIYEGLEKPQAALSAEQKEAADALEKVLRDAAAGGYEAFMRAWKDADQAVRLALTTDQPELLEELKAICKPEAA